MKVWLEVQERNPQKKRMKAWLEVQEGSSQKKRMKNWLEVQECIPIEEENEGLSVALRRRE